MEVHQYLHLHIGLDGSGHASAKWAQPAYGGGSRSDERLPADTPLVSEQVMLALDPAAIAGEAAVGAHHPVAGDDDADRVLPVGQANGARRRRLPDPPSHLPIGDFLPLAHTSPPRPDAAPKRGPLQT